MCSRNYSKIIQNLVLIVIFSFLIFFPPNLTTVGGSVTLPIISDLDLEISQDIEVSERLTTVNYPTKTIEIIESSSALF
ncbi:MAG: hypothetical protein ACXADY_25975, partial [Candidatus Hodarchaeales archaeon]